MGKKVSHDPSYAVDSRKWPLGINWIYSRNFSGSPGIPQCQTLPRGYPVCIITGGISSRDGSGGFSSHSPLRVTMHGRRQQIG
jgi:hypothetical protein